MSQLTFSRVFGSRSELVLVCFMVGILMVLFTPIPPMVLDFLLILNFAFGFLVLLLTFYTDRPIGFSTFPTILLIATLFRLSLNIAATRLILSDAHAGSVIGAVGAYVVGGNYVIGLVVFLILIVVQFVVVTSGAQRVAEVAARFTLDSMPGKQMSIDADLNMGLIDEKEAQKRRTDVEREASFYGSMDGASKFVKGDAIAGIIIILINIIGGLAIGVGQKGFEWGEALHIYTLLTVGDGIVTQIPALIISIATGIIVTRAATDAFFGDELAKQISQYPKSLAMVAFFLLGLLLLPGIPVTPVLFFLCLALVIFYFANQKSDTASEAGDDSALDEERSVSDEALLDEMQVDPVSIHVGKGLIDFVASSESVFLAKIKAFRKQYAMEMGLIIPEVRIVDLLKGDTNHYEIRLYGNKVGEGDIYPDRTLAISVDGPATLEGIATKDPSYGLPAVWITDEIRQANAQSGHTMVNPVVVFFTHFTEIIKSRAQDLLSRDETVKLLNRFKIQHPGLYEELIPAVLSIGDVQRVLQGLLKEKVSIRNLSFVMEALADGGRMTKSVDELVELVRQRLGSVICEPLQDAEGVMQVLTLDAKVEHFLQRGLRADDQKTMLIIEPGVLESLMQQLRRHTESLLQKSIKPVLLCSPSLRRHLKRLTERSLPQLSILSLNEIPGSMNIKSADVIRVDRLAEEGV